MGGPRDHRLLRHGQPNPIEQDQTPLKEHTLHITVRTSGS